MSHAFQMNRAVEINPCTVLLKNIISKTILNYWIISWQVSCIIEAECMLKKPDKTYGQDKQCTNFVTWKGASKDKLWLILIAIQCWLSVHHEFLICYTAEITIGDGKMMNVLCFLFWYNLVAWTSPKHGWLFTNNQIKKSIAITNALHLHYKALLPTYKVIRRSILIKSLSWWSPRFSKVQRQGLYKDPTVVKFQLIFFLLKGIYSNSSTPALT